MVWMEFIWDICHFLYYFPTLKFQQTCMVFVKIIWDIFYMTFPTLKINTSLHGFDRISLRQFFMIFPTWNFYSTAFYTFFFYHYFKKIYLKHYLFFWMTFPALKYYTIFHDLNGISRRHFPIFSINFRHESSVRVWNSFETFF